MTGWEHHVLDEHGDTIHVWLERVPRTSRRAVAATCLGVHPRLSAGDHGVVLGDLAGVQAYQRALVDPTDPAWDVLLIASGTARALVTLTHERAA